MMMHITIFDDEEAPRTRLLNILNDWKATYLSQLDIHSYTNGEAFMFDWEEGFIFDIVFLDIQMDKQTGMDIAQKIRKKNENAIIVFVTNFIDYVLLCTLIM